MANTNTLSQHDLIQNVEPTLQVLRSGDPNTAFHNSTPTEILEQYGMPRSLLSTSSKTVKCQKVGVLARVMYLTPGIFCPNATKGCLAGCLGHSSGRMKWPTHATARDRRAALYLDDPDAFTTLLRYELRILLSDARREQLTPAARLNGSSDISWEEFHPQLFHSCPDIQFYDYTKSVTRMRRFLAGDRWPQNYHLTFSVAADNHLESQQILAAGGTVAAVFHPELPGSWNGHKVIDGDQHDARFFDDDSQVVGLRAKGDAKQDMTGFTILAA